MQRIHLSRQTVQFAFFDTLLGHPDWRGSDVLDFGGNVGNLLRDPRSTIEPGRYWCIDVIKEALEMGRRAFPQAHWVFYDRRHCEFNPGGVPELPVPPTPVPFDYVLAYSVFSHTCQDEMVALVNELRARLRPGGTLAFSFIDPHYTPPAEGFPGTNLQWRLEKLRENGFPLDVGELLDRARNAMRCTLMDGELRVDEDADHAGPFGAKGQFLTLFSPRQMKSLFPDAEIHPPPAAAYRPPAPTAEHHHCCVLRKL